MKRCQMLMAGATVATIFGIASPALATPGVPESFILDVPGRAADRCPETTSALS